MDAIGTLVKLAYIPAEALVLYAQESIDAALEHVPAEHLATADVRARDVTGIAVIVGEGEYTQIWATDFSAPYLLSSTYTKIL